MQRIFEYSLCGVSFLVQVMSYSEELTDHPVSAPDGDTRQRVLLDFTYQTLDPKDGVADDRYSSLITAQEEHEFLTIFKQLNRIPNFE